MPFNACFFYDIASGFSNASADLSRSPLALSNPTLFSRYLAIKAVIIPVPYLFQWFDVWATLYIQIIHFTIAGFIFWHLLNCYFYKKHVNSVHQVFVGVSMVSDIFFFSV
jgi:hypothetical protein